MQDDLEEPVTVFNYETFASYFAAYIEDQKKTKRNFSYRFLCRKTGIKSPALLTWLATGKRLPTPDILEKLNDAFNWRPDEYAYAQSLVSFERSKSDSDRMLHLKKMREIAPAKNLTILEKAATDIFLKWHIATILEMTHLKDFKLDTQWISERLGGKISPAEVQSALNVLTKTGLMVEDAEKGLRREGKSLRTRDNIPIYAVRGWHSEMMKLAQRAVHLQEPAERFFSGVTMTIDEARMPEAQALLAEFRERFVTLVQTDQGNETYHFAVQFFRLTKKGGVEGAGGKDGEETSSEIRSASTPKAS